MVQISYKKLYGLVLVLLFCGLSSKADVTFKFSAGTIDAGPLKTKMENNISALLTEITRAGSSAQLLDLSRISMESAAKTRLVALWDDARFVCDRAVNVSKCLNDFQGYQVRAIPITMKPLDSSYNQSLNRELTISLNKSGVITGVRPAWELHEDVSKILNNPGGIVSDTRQRMEILKWVEDFRCYYNEKNINALDQIYSNDALIITGSVVSKRNFGDTGVRFENKTHYKVQSKTEYITNLKGVFNKNKHINVKFDHISVVMSGSKKNIYGVTLHQTWQGSTYCDEGWLFLLWDFNDKEKPQIHVRTWQSDQVAALDDVFTIDDFFIP